MTQQRIVCSGVRLEVDTDHAEFADYLAAQFPERPSEPPEIAVRVRWKEGARDHLAPPTVFPGWPVEMRIDRHVWLGAGRILVLQNDDAPMIAVASEPAASPRRFEVRYHFSLGDGWRERMTRALRPARLSVLRRKRLSTLTYYAAYYPAWWHLESRGGGHPLHASGVVVDGRGLLLAGLPGCGKSTLTLSFLGEPGAEILSDNIVLHDGAEISACFEPLLLDERSRALLAKRVALQPLGRRHQYERDAFHVPHRTTGVPLAAAVLLGRGRTTRLTKVPSHDCARMILAMNEAAKEIRRYHVLSGILALAEPAALGHLDQRLAQLDRLLAGVPCWFLEVREGVPAEGVEALRGLVARATEVAS